MRRFYAAFVVAIALLLVSCATPPANPTAKSPVPTEPPPLAVESFQTVWETIRDTHFDTNFSGVNWEAARTTFLPKIQQARTQDEVRDVMQEMLDLLGHSHLMILPGSPIHPSATNNSITRPDPVSTSTSAPRQKIPAPTGAIGIDVRAVDKQIVVFRVEPNSPATRAGIKPGDIIEKIDGEPAIDPTVLEVNKRSREFLLWHYAADLLKGSIDEPCELTLANRKKISVPRALESGEISKLGNLPVLLTRVSTNEFNTPAQKRVGYIRFNYWMIPAIPHIDRFIDEYRNADGIIVDLRGNLGGIGGMVMGTAGHLVNQRASLGTMKMRENELRFNIFPRRVDLQSRATNTFRNKLAILTDPITLSSAELFAGGLQELGRARVFGERTGGQALPAIAERLPNGDLLYHAVADFNTPKGRRLETNGVEPDELIPLRIEALRDGRDEPLEAALRWMDSPLK